VNDVMEQHISALQLNTRTELALQHAGIELVAQVARLTRKQLLCVKNVGKKGAREVHERLTRIGLSLGTKLDSSLEARFRIAELEHELRVAKCKLSHYERYKHASLAPDIWKERHNLLHMHVVLLRDALLDVDGMCGSSGVMSDSADAVRRSVIHRLEEAMMAWAKPVDEEEVAKS